MNNSAPTSRRSLFPKSITPVQSKDTGMAMTLIALIAGFAAKNTRFFVAAVVLLIVTMTVPNVYRPVAKVWLGLSHLLGTVASKLLLTVVFFVVITPMGLLKRMFGSEPLQLRAWKKGDASVFVERGQACTPSDLEKPF
jgi:predicted small integral membrane protein